MSPILEDYARDIIQNRIHEAQRDALADLAKQRGIPYDPRARLVGRAQQPFARPFAAAARDRLAEGLRFVARRLDPCVPTPESWVVIARSR